MKEKTIIRTAAVLMFALFMVGMSCPGAGAQMPGDSKDADNVQNLCYKADPQDKYPEPFTPVLNIAPKILTEIQKILAVANPLIEKKLSKMSETFILEADPNDPESIRSILFPNGQFAFTFTMRGTRISMDEASASISPGLGFVKTQISAPSIRGALHFTEATSGCCDCTNPDGFEPADCCTCKAWETFFGSLFRTGQVVLFQAEPTSTIEQTADTCVLANCSAAIPVQADGTSANVVLDHFNMTLMAETVQQALEALQEENESFFQNFAELVICYLAKNMDPAPCSGALVTACNASDWNTLMDLAPECFVDIINELLTESVTIDEITLDLEQMINVAIETALVYGQDVTPSYPKGRLIQPFELDIVTNGYRPNQTIIDCWNGGGCSNSTIGQTNIRANRAPDLIFYALPLIFTFGLILRYRWKRRSNGQSGT